MMKVFLDDDDDDELKNHFRINHDEIMTFSLEKTSDQITPFVVDVDHDEMLSLLLVLLFDFDDEYHQMDSNQNLKIQFNSFQFPFISLSHASKTKSKHSFLLFSPTLITRRVHLSKEFINDRSDRLMRMICIE